jgi:NAD(P)-dependent dehydrogenase (short-subunit alcohol dehydrogenase family)
MQLQGKVTVVTGGGNGIGAASCRAFAAEGAHVVVADLDGAAAEQVAAQIGGLAVGCDVTQEAEVQALVERATRHFGAVDLFFSNAGLAVGGGLDTPIGDWQRVFAVNVTAQVLAAQAVLPQMLARGEGYLLNTASAAGLLSVSDPSYAVAKHGSVAFAEWLAIQYGERGIRVGCFCPQGVRTRMLLESADGGDREALLAGSVSPEQAAMTLVRGIADERFFILTHPEVLDYVRRKADDEDRWLRGMRRFQGTARKPA